MLNPNNAASKTRMPNRWGRQMSFRNCRKACQRLMRYFARCIPVMPIRSLKRVRRDGVGSSGRGLRVRSNILERYVSE